jgi:hypothetical protein
MTVRHDTRLVIAERPARRNHLHGAWWPYTTDIERELAPMLSLAVTRVGAVLGLALNRDEWPGAPLVPQPPANSRTKISWYGLTEPHLATLHCGGHNRIALLVLPPDAPEQVALTAMLMASAPGNCLTTTETLARAREGVQPTWSTIASVTNASHVTEVSDIPIASDVERRSGDQERPSRCKGFMSGT